MNKLGACVVFLLGLVAGQARAASIDPFARVDAALAVFKHGLDEMDSCFDSEDSLRADLAAKKAEYQSRYHGKIPADFEQLLGRKADRIRRVHETCTKQFSALNAPFLEVRYAFIAVGPGHEDPKKQKAVFQQLSRRYNVMTKRSKSAGARKGAQAGSESEGGSGGGESGGESNGASE